VNLFLRLMLGHIIGDFVFQTGRIAEMKRVGLQGLAIHLSLVMLATAAATAGAPHWTLVVLTLGVVHLATDSLRTYLFRDLRRWQSVYFVCDQATHMASWALIAFWLGNYKDVTLRSLVTPQSSADKVALIVSAILSLIFVVPVMEALVQMDAVAEHPPNSKITNRTRALGAIERILGFLVMQTSWAIVAPVLFLPHFAYRMYGPRSDNGLSTPQRLIRPSVSLAMTLLIGWLARLAL